jgi:cobalt/nickel transport system permease protein/energy-coupling factor transport system permease protein
MEILRKSILQLYPTTKLLFVLFLCLSVFIIPSFLYGYSVFFLCWLIAWLAGEGGSFFRLAIRALLLIVLFIFLLQSFFYPGTHILWSWWIFSLRQEGIDFSLQLTSRIVTIGSAIILFFRITEVKDLVSACEQMGFSPKATYILMSSLQIIPEMRNQAYVIMDAQRTRGVETEGSLWTRTKAFLPTLSPLILGAIANTEERALALEARAFSTKGAKTSLYRVQKSRYDRAVRIVLLVLLLLIIAGRVFL